MLIVPDMIPTGVVVEIVPQGDLAQLECQRCGVVGEPAQRSELLDRRVWHLQHHDGARTIQIELTAQERDHLEQRGQEWGMDLEQLVSEVLQRMIQPPPRPEPASVPERLGKVS